MKRNMRLIVLGLKEVIYKNMAACGPIVFLLISGLWLVLSLVGIIELIYFFGDSVLAEHIPAWIRVASLTTFVSTALIYLSFAVCDIFKYLKEQGQARELKESDKKR